MKVAWAMAALLAGCAHTPHGRYDASTRRMCAGDVCYQTGELPRGWQLVHHERAALGFYNQALGGVIESNASCRDDADAATLDVLTRHLLIGYTERKIERTERVMLAAREALSTEVEAKLDGVPVKLRIYVLKRNGCVFDLSYAAPPPVYARGRADFERFVGGFADLRARS